MAYEIKIEKFEGPLDLLLHLIRKNEMEIYDIPIAEVTAQYLSALDAMKSLNLDVAGEFLLMAATLLHIKSRMLLPVESEEEPDQEEEDPRAELVRRLLEYQRYKEAGTIFDALPRLGRDVFTRTVPDSETGEADAVEFKSVGLFELAEAFRGLISTAPEEVFHEVQVEPLSVTERVRSILSVLAGKERIAFTELFVERPHRQDVVVTFLAMLELVRMRMVRLMQNARYGPIWLSPTREGTDMRGLELEEGDLGYA